MSRGHEHRADGSDLLSQYLQEISRIPRLTPERERELGRRVQQNDRAALEELVNANLRFVVSYAKRFRNSHVLFLDLINEGNIGLMQAAKKFDPDKNVKFITYAVWWIRQSILHALSEQGSTFRLPPKRANLLYRMEKVIGEIVTEENRFPSPEELSEKLNAPLKEVQTMLQSMTDSFSLSAELDGDSHTEIGDLIEQTTVRSAEDELQEQAAKGEILARISSLSPKERLILCLRHGVTDNMPKHVEELAEFMGREPAAVQAVLDSAVSKLCEGLQVSSDELSHLLLYTNPSPQAAVSYWIGLGDLRPAPQLSPDRLPQLERLKQKGAVQSAMDELTLDERVLLKLRHGILTDELTLRDIGELLNLSRERVRQIEARAEAKCRRLVRREQVRPSRRGA